MAQFEEEWYDVAEAVGVERYFDPEYDADVRDDGDQDRPGWCATCHCPWDTCDCSSPVELWLLAWPMASLRGQSKRGQTRNGRKAIARHRAWRKRMRKLGLGHLLTDDDDLPF
jgi:hypothetical protein